jgi:hypothetical protein
MQRYNILLYFLFFFSFCMAGDVGPQLAEFRKYHTTYFITREMIGKHAAAYSLKGGYVRCIDYFYEQWQIKEKKVDINQDNFLLHVNIYPDGETDEIIVLDGMGYSHNEAYGNERTVVINVTMDYVRIFLESLIYPGYGNKRLLIAIQNNSKVRELLTRKQQDKDVENFLFCNRIHHFPHESKTIAITRYKKMFEDIVFSAKNGYCLRIGLAFLSMLVLLGRIIFYSNNTYVVSSVFFGECVLSFFTKNQYYTYLKLCTAYEELKNRKE